MIDKTNNDFLHQINIFTLRKLKHNPATKQNIIISLQVAVSKRTMFLYMLLVLTATLQSSLAFLSANSMEWQKLSHSVSASSSSSTPLSMTPSSSSSQEQDGNDKASSSSDWWDQFRNFWDKESMGQQQQQQQDQSSGSGLYQLASIPVEAMKPGGLRLFLMLYLMGMQNTPQPKTWQAHQPSSGSNNNFYSNNDETTTTNLQQQQHVLEMYFHDETAMLRIRLLPQSVILERQGSTPSTSYLMQETALIDGIWNELLACATQDDVPDENRLVRLSPQAQSIMDQAQRERLSFG